MSSPVPSRAEPMPALRPQEAESWWISSRFSFRHTELGGAFPEKRGPKQGKQPGAGGAFSFLNKYTAQFRENSGCTCTSGNNSQDEILTSAALNAAGALHGTVKCQFIQHSTESYLKGKISSWRNREAKEVRHSILFFLKLAQCSADGSCLINFCWMRKKKKNQQENKLKESLNQCKPSYLMIPTPPHTQNTFCTKEQV